MLTGKERAAAANRAYQRAMSSLRRKYSKEFSTFMNSEECRGTYTDRYQKAKRYLRFRHPVVFKRLNESFRQIEGL
jgi:hypothetical protein